MSNLRILARPRLKSPMLVAGLPGIANIGKLAVEYLIHKLGAVKLAELYSEHFPEWAVQENGSLRTLKMDFYYAKPKGMKNDLILVTADAQAATPTGQYELTGEVFDLAEKMKVKTVATMAAYVLSQNEVQSKSVVGVVSDPKMAELLKKHNVNILSGGMVVGMNGLLPALANSHHMKGICLMGTTKGGLLDVGASEAVLRALNSLIGLKVDLQELHHQAEALLTLKSSFLKLSKNLDEELSYIR